jgi:hypothetical protein
MLVARAQQQEHDATTPPRQHFADFADPGPAFDAWISIVATVSCCPRGDTDIK